MKLLSCRPPGSDHFRFLFAEMSGNQPILFEYDSRTDNWSSTEVEETDEVGGGVRLRREASSNSNSNSKTIFLSAYNGRSGSVVIAKGTGDRADDNDTTPVVVRPRFVGLGENDGGGGQLAVGFSRGNAIDRLHVYGDGNVMIIKSYGAADANRRMIRMLSGIELWGLSSNGGRQWELISRVPTGLVEKIRKPYGAMMGCLEEQQRLGVVRAVLMSNLEGVWDIIWLCYDVEFRAWNWLPIPDCKMKGANMAGIAFSCGLTLG